MHHFGILCHIAANSQLQLRAMFAEASVSLSKKNCEAVIYMV